MFNLGRVAASGKLSELTGPLRSVYEVRVKGDAKAFLTDLRDAGCEWSEAPEGFRVSLVDGSGPGLIFKTARECGVQVRHLRPSAQSLEEVFLQALGASPGEGKPRA